MTNPPNHGLASLPPEFEAERLIGEGAAAHVYLARETRLGRAVAIKVLKVADGADTRLAARFEREAKAVASIAHPNVVSVHQYGRLESGTPYLVMHYVRGRSLADRLRIEHRLPEADVTRLVCDIAGALAAAHARGIIHRDVRPANILWEEETGRFLLADFGLAAVLEQAAGEHALTHAGELLGDVRYVSPEQLRTERVTEAADIYSLGVLALEALTGNAPEGTGTRLALVTNRMSGKEEATPTAGSAPINRIIASCLANDPHHRPTAAMVVRMIQSGLHGDVSPDVSKAGIPGGRVMAIIRRKRLPQWVGGAAAAGWVFLEVVAQLDQQNIVASMVYPLTLITLIAVLVATCVLAWYHGEHGTQKAPASEKWLLVLIGIGWLAALTMYLAR